MVSKWMLVPLENWKKNLKKIEKQYLEKDVFFISPPFFLFWGNGVFLLLQNLTNLPLYLHSVTDLFIFSIFIWPAEQAMMLA